MFGDDDDLPLHKHTDEEIVEAMRAENKSLRTTRKILDRVAEDLDKVRGDK